ncbi:MAG: hypothetical protein U0R78_09890 [Nocardioidaceae bacterium]
MRLARRGGGDREHVPTAALGSSVTSAIAASAPRATVSVPSRACRDGVHDAPGRVTEGLGEHDGLSLVGPCLGDAVGHGTQHLACDFELPRAPSRAPRANLVSAVSTLSLLDRHGLVIASRAAETVKNMLVPVSLSGTG